MDTSKFIRVDIWIFQFNLESRCTPRNFVLFTWGISISSMWSAGLTILPKPKIIKLVFVIFNESWFAQNQSVSLSMSFWSSDVAWITFLWLLNRVVSSANSIQSLFTKLRCKSLTKKRIAEVQAHYFGESPHLGHSNLILQYLFGY